MTCKLKNCKEFRDDFTSPKLYNKYFQYLLFRSSVSTCNQRFSHVITTQMQYVITIISYSITNYFSL